MNERLPELDGYRLRIDGLQPPGDRQPQPDDDLIISIPNGVQWPMLRRRAPTPVGGMLTEEQVADLNRVFLQAVAEALAEIDEDGGLHHG